MRVPTDPPPPFSAKVRCVKSIRPDLFLLYTSLFQHPPPPRLFSKSPVCKVNTGRPFSFVTKRTFWQHAWGPSVLGVGGGGGAGHTHTLSLKPFSHSTSISLQFPRHLFSLVSLSHFIRTSPRPLSSLWHPLILSLQFTLTFEQWKIHFHWSRIIYLMINNSLLPLYTSGKISCFEKCRYSTKRQDPMDFTYYLRHQHSLKKLYL